MAEPVVYVFPDLDALSRRAADFFVKAAGEAVASHGRFTVALSGGSTPKSLYSLLGSPDYIGRVEWEKADIFWGDERCVPPSDWQSNFHMAEQTLLKNVSASVHRIRGEDKPEAAARACEEELRRVLPVVQALCEQTAVPVSIDTSKSPVAKEAVAAGAEIINDVTGLAGDPEMADLAAETSAGVCVMHMLGTPQTMQEDPQYDDVVEDIFAYLRDRRDKLIARGFDSHRVCLDPGIGFGKTHQHNLILTARCGRFAKEASPCRVATHRADPQTYGGQGPRP